MANLFGGHRRGDPTEAAQDIIYEAWEATTRSKRIALARKALKVSPLCADAYVLLAEEEARSVEEVLDYYQKGVEAGEMALGPEGFEEYAGHFWGFLETRPYMRARAGLAAALWRLGRHQDAIDHYQEMLELNPNDNQGIRYVLAGHLLARNEIKPLKKLLKQFEEDGAAAWLYTPALLAFRENDPDADKLAEEAWLANSHVPGVLSGKQPLVASMDGYITMGGEDEAADYVEENGRAWQSTPGAIEWLVDVTRKLKPRRRRGSADV
ncbi:tetratricopeptide repeat protein [Allomesorhizobium camelthorni]|uniref:Tetratricopeptide repeat protein n=1 Tax=Allomesorhizobium camelthorni TaxID=475069 RepID=A0A6G4WIL8_9HYPH|nr:tetratricopeptide repeat protein [Mesorhizobium camelthorni]NGO54645.1 tetratricopeptide repeat protein [Mesorhizobium camelthorni]